MSQAWLRVPDMSLILISTMAIVVLRGEVETFGRRLKPHGLIYFAAGEPHGMRNPGKGPAYYLVFEFHGRVPLWRKVTDLHAWKRKFKTVLNLY